MVILVLQPNGISFAIGEVIMTKPTRWKLLVATSDETEAHLLKHRLSSEGIPCRIEAESTYPGVPHGGRSREVQVYVPVTEFETSQQVIENTDFGEEEQ